MIFFPLQLIITLAEAYYKEFSLSQSSSVLITSFQELAIDPYPYYYIKLFLVSSGTVQALLAANKSTIMAIPYSVATLADALDYDSWISCSNNHYLSLNSQANWNIAIYTNDSSKLKWKLEIYGFYSLTCVNDCSHNGNCFGSGCICYTGWAGIDCSIQIQSMTYDSHYLASLQAKEFAYYSYFPTVSTDCEIKKQLPSLSIYIKPLNTGLSILTGPNEYYTKCILTYGDLNGNCRFSSNSIIGFKSDTHQIISFNCPLNNDSTAASPVLMWVLLSVATIVILIWVSIAVIKCSKFKRHRAAPSMFTPVVKTDRFPVSSFKDLGKENGEECSVCQQKFMESDLVRLLDCGHFYHKECIDEWFQRHQICCVCKKEYLDGECFARATINEPRMEMEHLRDEALK